MTNDNKTQRTIGCSFTSICFLISAVLLVLKLGKVASFATVSWLWVCLPAVIGFTLPIGIFLSVVFFFFCATVIAALDDK